MNLKNSISIVCLTLLLTGCSHFSKYQTFFRDRTEDYKNSSVAKPLKIPQEYHQPSTEPLFPIPGLDS